MRIVIDASVIIAVIANEPEKESLIKLTQNADLIAPYSVHWEIGNAFSSMIKKRRINGKQASEALSIYQNIPVNFVNVDLSESILLAEKYNIYCYDAYLLQCGLEHRYPLISLDAKLNQCAVEAGIKILEV